MNCNSFYWHYEFSMNFDNTGIVSGTFLRQRWVFLLVDGAMFYWDLLWDALYYYVIHRSTSKILTLHKNKCLTGLWNLDFARKGYKTFGLDGHTFDRRWIFLYRKGDNNYGISVTILVITKSYCYNTEYSVVLQQNHRSSHWRCSVKQGVFKNFAIFTGKHLYWRLQHSCFPLRLAKFLRTLF